jgi:hypothetical protein
MTEQLLAALPPRWVRLGLERARAAGVPFSDAWPLILAAIRGPDTDAWRAVLSATEDAWRRAFDGEPPTSAEEAVLLWAGDELADLTLVRRCEHCDGEIAADRDRRARYCSDGCRAAAWHLAHARTDNSESPGGVRSPLPDAGEVTSNAA